MHKFKPIWRPPLAVAAGIPFWRPMALGAALIALLVHSAHTATAPAFVAAPVPLVPMYSPAEVMQGLYSHHLPPLSQRFSAETDALVATTQQYCQTAATTATSLIPRQAAWHVVHTQWQHTMVAWESLSTPALGPILTRRSQRQIDFWPTRPELLAKALAKAPQTLTDMETVGTLAKGLPAFELLLAQWQPTAPSRLQLPNGRVAEPAQPQPELSGLPAAVSVASCQYLGLLAQGVQAEATELSGELTIWAARDWSQTPDDTASAMAESVNQWLAGLERLRWAHIEKPLKIVQTSGESRKNKPPKFARLDRDANLASWRAQWHSLLDQARLNDTQRINPPTPSQAVIPIEAVLLGEGHIVLAQRWAKALDAVTESIDQLPAQINSPTADERELLALTTALKAVSVLFQNEVASALDVSLGFSDADGD